MAKLKGNNEFGQFSVEHGSEIIAPYVTNYPRSYSAAIILRSLKSHEAVLTGPVYSGELERFFFDPLLTAAKKVLDGSYVEGDIAKDMYARSMNYALLTEFLTLTQSKYVALELNASAIKTQPLFIALQSNAHEKLDDAKLRETLKKAKDEPVSWSSLDAGSKILAALIDSLSVDAISTLNSLADYTNMTSSNIGDFTTMDSAFEALQQWLGKGKGVALSGLNRSIHVNDRNKIRMAIEQLLGKFAGLTVIDTASEATSFADGMALALAFVQYLQMVDQYDSHAPKMPYQAVPAAWAMSLQVAAGRMSSFWLTPARASFQFDIYCAEKAWREQLPIWEPIVSGYNNYPEMIRLFDSKMEPFASSLSGQIKSWVDEAWDRLKEYMQAKYLVTGLHGVDIPPNLVNKLADVAGEIPVPKVTLKYKDGKWENMGTAAKASFPLLDASQIELTKTVTKYQAVSWNDGHTVLIALAETARSIHQTAETYLRVADIGANAYGDLLHLQPPTKFEDFNWLRLPLKGNLREMARLDFDQVDPITRIYTPYQFKKSENDMRPAIKWKLKDLMFRPLDYNQLMLLLEEQGSHAMVWPTPQTYPVDDLITSQYAMGVIPYCYTGTRRRRGLPHTISSYQAIASDPNNYSGMGLDSSNPGGFFKDAANVLYQLGSEYATQLANALAGNFWIYVSEEKNAKKWIEPSVPAIYGLPTGIYHTLDSVLVPNSNGATSRKAVKTLTADDLDALANSDRAVKVEIARLDNSYKYTVWFVLHGSYPKPGAHIYTSWSPYKGVSVVVPVLSSIWKNPADTLANYISDGEIVAALATNALADPTGKDLLLYPQGFSDLKAPWSHITWSTAILGDNPLLSEVSWYAFGTVSIYQNAITKEIRVRGKAKSDITILDYADYEAAMSLTDPVLPVSAAEVKQAPIESDKRNDDAPGGIAAHKPAASKLGPDSVDSAIKAAARVTDAPIVVEDELGAVRIEAPNNAPENDKPRNTPAPLSGDSDMVVESETKGADKTQPEKRKYYFKKTTDSGEIIEVVALDENRAPEGFVPSSEAEYLKFNESGR